MSTGAGPNQAEATGRAETTTHAQQQRGLAREWICNNALLRPLLACS